MTTTTSSGPSSNWLALQKSLVRHGRPRKRRRVESVSDTTYVSPCDISSKQDPDKHNERIDLETAEIKNGQSIAALRKMVLGKVEFKTSQTAPGKYLALDCEMVGVGIEGNESSLARVSIVNYTGAIILDVFVRQRERVIDYRTQWSGVRSTDLASLAKPFKEVQQTVADLIKNRILIGHAINNDLKALLLSHPSPQIRDTQSLAYKHRVVKSRRPALRVLVKQELGIVIQGGEHSSVTDARATMALFRLHKKQWENGFRSFHKLIHPQSRDKIEDDFESISCPFGRVSPLRGQKRKHSDSSKFNDGDNDADVVAEASSSSSLTRAHSSPSSPPHIHQRHKRRSTPQQPINSTELKRISSGISTITKRVGGVKEIRTKGKGVRMGDVGNSSKCEKKTNKVSGKWWKSLGGGKKGSVRL